MKNAHTITRIALATAVIAIPAAWAQNALDANPQVGSTGSNSNQPTRIYGQGVNTNLMITGNTTGGTAFRSYSPIRSTTEFGLGSISLPSSSLSNFRRDTFGVSD